MTYGELWILKDK